MIAFISLIGFSVSEWGVIDMRTAKAITSVATMEADSEKPRPIVKAPVIYFYGKMPKEIALSLEIPTDKLTASDPEFTGFNERPSWRIKPYNKKNKPSCWTDPEASPIIANGKACDYIFYEAKVSYEETVYPFREEGKVGFMNSGRYPVYDLIYVTTSPDGEGFLSYYIPELAPSQAVFSEPTSIPNDDKIKLRMVSAGLTEGAAAAFLKEWWETFQKPANKTSYLGIPLVLSVLAYRLSPDEVNELLPLILKPEPERLVRTWWVLIR